MNRYHVKIRSIMQVSSVLLAHDVAPADVLKNLEVPSILLVEPDAWIERTLAFRLALVAERLTNDRFLGAHTAELSKLEQFGNLGVRILQSKSLREALQEAANNVCEVATGLDIDLIETNHHARVRMQYAGPLGQDPMHYQEANLLIIKKIIELATETVPARYRVPHNMPTDTTELERLLGQQLEFTPGAAEIEFDRGALDLPLRPGIVPMPREAVYQAPRTPRETAGAVMRVLRDIIALERPTAATVAGELDMNLRTMQRHLAAWGLTFETVLDELRRRRAAAYLKDGKHSITEIAFLLGYSDSAHFARACKRWTGHAPRQLVGDPLLTTLLG